MNETDKTLAGLPKEFWDGIGIMQANCEDCRRELEAVRWWINSIGYKLNVDVPDFGTNSTRWQVYRERIESKIDLLIDSQVTK